MIVPEGRDEVVLLDADAAVIGRADKLGAHERSLRHLAFSVVLVDSDGAVLLQRRAHDKYHFAGLWSNSCCSHPRPGEGLLAAAHRRVREELGVRCGPLAVHGAFWYEAHDPASGMTEHEYDVVLVGPMRGEPVPDPAEVAAVALCAPDDLRASCASEPWRYTPWLSQVLELTAAGPRPLPEPLGSLLVRSSS